MSDTCLPPQTETPGPEWRAVSEQLLELTGSAVSARTVQSWASKGLPTLRGRRGTLLCRRTDLLAFLRGRGPQLAKAPA